MEGADSKSGTSNKKNASVDHHSEMLPSSSVDLKSVKPPLVTDDVLEEEALHPDQIKAAFAKAAALCGSEHDDTGHD